MPAAEWVLMITDVEDGEDDAPAVQDGSCLKEAVLITVLMVLIFLGSVAYIVAQHRGWL